MIKRVLTTLALAALLILLDVTAAQGNELPESAYITGVNGHPQKHSLSCESRSAADLAAYWGISLGENEFLDALPRSDNPEQGFVGSPDAGWGNTPPHGYGVHAGPVADTLRSFGLHAEAYNHLGWDDLRREISAGRPVIVWIIGAMWSGQAVEYQAADGSTSIVARYEHTMLLIGYTRDTVQVVDAFSGQYQTYALKSFLDSWSVLGHMAVFSSLEADEQTAPPEEEQAEPGIAEPQAQTDTVDQSLQTYTVQPGDYLTELANRFGTTLQKLIDLNSIAYPFTIYPGQVLQFPAGNLPAQAPEPATPAPVDKLVKFEMHLPLVYRDYTVPVAAVPVNQTSPPAFVPLASTQAASPTPYCSSPVVNWALLTRLRNIMVPILYQNGGILLK